jgi:hypothetical protein
MKQLEFDITKIDLNKYQEPCGFNKQLCCLLNDKEKKQNNNLTILDIEYYS